SLSGVAREVRTAAGTSQLAERAVPLPLPLPVRTGGSPSGARDAAQRAERLAAIAPALPAPRTGTGRGTGMGRGGEPRAMRDGLLRGAGLERAADVGGVAPRVAERLAPAIPAAGGLAGAREL